MVTLLVLSLTFPLTFNAYAVDGTPEATSNPGITLDKSTGGQNDLQTTSPAIKTTEPAIETTEPALTTDEVKPETPEFAGNLDALPDSIKKAIEEMGTQRSLAASKYPQLRIDSVQVVNGGAEQARNRDYVTYNEAKKAYFTSHRNASMTDARIFTVFAVFDKGYIDTDYTKFDISKVDFTYGGKSLDEWKQYKKTKDENGKRIQGWFGDPAISVLSQVHYTDGDKLVVVAKIKFDEFFDDGWYSVNFPYEGYTPSKKEAYGRIIEDPKFLGPHDLDMIYNKCTIASTPISLNLYDSFHTWDQINEYASILKELPDENSKINGRYVSVKSLTKSETGLDVWNVIIAKDQDAVDCYLNTTKPLMEDDPAALAEIIAKEGSPADTKSVTADENGPEYSKIPIYFNNVHPDEVPASDAIMELIDSFIYQNELSFDTQTDAVPHERTPKSDGYTSQGPGNLTVKQTFQVKDILDRFILVLNITENPEGKANLVRTNDYGFDLNRDAAYQTQKESTALTSDLVKWDPLTMLEYHGYMDGLLIEPCTGPHDPNYEYDLFAKKMLDQGNTIGKAMIGNTAYTQYLVPATDYSDGWDDGAPVYGPMFAMLYGTMGYTLEIPYSTEDSKEACYTAGLAMVKDCLDNRADYYLNKLKIKERGVNNEDNANVDKFLIDPYTGDELGRPRISKGVNFFPDYYVIPVNEEYQKNQLEAYKALEFLERNGAELMKTTCVVDFDGKQLPKDTYVIDMRQANRSFINSMLSDGYDASRFKDIYAEIVISYPDMRNFDCLTVRSKGLFDGKITDAGKIARPETMIGGESERVVIKNDNIDAIRLVNKLLDNEKTVEMLTADYKDYNKGDFIISRADMDEALGEFDEGLLVFGSPFVEEVEEQVKSIESSDESAETITLVDPEIGIIGYEGHSRYIMDLLGFTGDYSYPEDINEISEGTDVLVGFDTYMDYSDLVSGGGIGFIGIGTDTMASVEESSLLPGLDCFIPDYDTTEYYREGLMRSHYSDTNLITANYDRTTAAYVMNGTYITRAPFDSESLITIDNGANFFKAGWYPNHDVLKGESLAVSGFSGSNHDVPVTLFANNIFSKAHAQHTYNMFANAVFLTAADYGTDKPFIEATPGSQETSATSVDVTLKYTPSREPLQMKADVDSEFITKYKITNSEAEKPFNFGSDWSDYTSATAIKLATTGAFYIHAYAENSLGESIQRVFGPYNIGTSGGTPGGNTGAGTGSGHGGGGGGGSSTPVITPPAVTAPAISFSDISGHWAKASIEYAVGKKLFSGVSDNLFAPDTTMTRGMLVTVLGRAYGLDTASYSGKSVFTDVPSNAYYAPYVAWAYEKKIVSGTGDGLFAPDKPVTRGEMAAIITNYMKFIGKGTASTADLTYADIAEIDSWGLDGVKFVTAKGLMTGTSGSNFDFDGLSTRAQVATVMERLLNLIGQ